MFRLEKKYNNTHHSKTNKALYAIIYTPNQKKKK